jgi:hypothetical protein
MSRILLLQKLQATGLESVGIDLPTAEASTSSFGACVCSSYSDSGCKPPPLFLAL